MLENINLALQGVWSHKLRSFLTMLGIIIGIAAIITIVSTIRGTNEQIKQNLIGAGNDMVQVQLTQDGSTVDFSYGELPEGIAAITSAMRDEMDALPGVSAVAMYRQRTWADGIYAGNQSFTGTLNGVDDHYLSVAGYQVNYGRAFLPEDFSSRRKVAVIDTTAAQSLFPGQNPIGGVIEMQGEPFTVVGVVSQRVTSQPVINSVEDYQMYARTTSGTVMIPESCWPIAFRYDEPMNVAVRASSTNDMTKTDKTNFKCIHSCFSFLGFNALKRVTTLYTHKIKIARKTKKVYNRKQSKKTGEQSIWKKEKQKLISYQKSRNRQAW